MQDTRKSIEAFLSLQASISEPSTDLTGLVVRLAAISPAILYVFDLKDQRCVFLNQRIYDTLGLIHDHPDENRSDLLICRMHPDDLKRIPEFEKQLVCASDDAVIRADFRLQHSSGEWRWLSSRSVIYQRDADGRPRQILTTAEDVTEKWQAKDALQEQAYLIEHAHDAIIVRDMEDRVRFWNNGAAEMYGWTKDEAAGQIKRELLKTDFPVPREEVIDQLITKGHWEGEIIHTRRDGTKIVVANRQMIPRDPVEQPHSILEINTDITDRKKTEAILQQSEKRFRDTFENAAIGLAHVGLDGRWLRVNQVLCNIVGYSAEELDIMTFADITDPADLEYDLQQVNRLLAGEISTYSMEKRYIRKGGSKVWVNLTVALMHDTAGEPLHFISAIDDIMARKQVEEVLRESEMRFRLLADSAPVLIWTAGLNNDFDYFNKPWLEFTGRTMEQELGNGWTDGIHPDDLQRYRDIYHSSFAVHLPFRTEYRLRRFDGQYRWLLATGSPRFSSDGTFLGYSGSCIDITDQKFLQHQLFESQKLESLGRLAGGIAHDFNNLLTAILGYNELSLTLLPDYSEVRPFLENVTVAAKRAADLTMQLLMYARRQMVEFTIVDLNKVILNMVSLLRRTIGEQYELVSVLSEEECSVNANASQMDQVLTNLVVNARDAMPSGGRILIETACVTLDDEYAEDHFDVLPGSYVIFSVSDTGMGMTDEVRNRIFEPFYTTKEIGKGTGLGLATCYGIIKQTKGNIWVYSEPGEGTTFKVYLPRVHNAAHSEPAQIPDNLPEGTETILLVDDEPMVRDIAARSLRSQGYRVLESSNGAEALHLQSEWQGSIDLLVTDVVMPLMGGKELAERLLVLNPKLKVMYISGYTHNVVLQQGVLKPGVVLLTKPFTTSSLLRVVSEVLGVT